MTKIKEFITGLLILSVILFLIIVIIGSFRSTDQTFVCSGDFIEKGKSPRHTNVKFEINDSRAGIPWNDNHWTYVKMFDNAPYVFYASEFVYPNTNPQTSSGKIIWSKTYYGTNLSIFAENDNGLLSFDFNTKILEINNYDKNGMSTANYNLLCVIPK